MKTMNDEGLGYSMIMIGVGLFGSALTLLFIAPVMNFFVGIANGLIGSNTVYVSAQTQGTFGFIVGMFAFLPVVILVGFLIGSYLDSVYEKDTAGGGML